MESEIEIMRHFKTTAVPVIVRALGMIKKETNKHIKRYLEVQASEIQKTVLCGTNHFQKRLESVRLEKYHPKEVEKS